MGVVSGLWDMGVISGLWRVCGGLVCWLGASGSVWFWCVGGGGAWVGGVGNRDGVGVEGDEGDMLDWRWGWGVVWLLVCVYVCVCG